MADYWIKLYHEILDDPKMATMPDNLWRRTVELFLLAGRLYKDGKLPDTKQIAWALRQNCDVLETELQQIVASGIVKREETGWFIPNFAKRQGASSSTERSAAYREKRQKQQYYGNATDSQRNVAQITDTDNRSDTDQITEPLPPVNSIYKYWEDEISPITPVIADFLDLYEKELPAGYVHDAIYEAVKHNARTMAYVKKILDTWKRDGKKDNPQRTATPPKPKIEYLKDSNGDYQRDELGRILYTEVPAC